MWLRQPRRPRTRHSLPTIAFFLACGATTAIAFNIALVYLFISLSTILLFTYPAFTALGAWLMLGQRPTLRHGGALLLTLAGAALIIAAVIISQRQSEEESADGRHSRATGSL